jgi:hypothetical protein
VAVPATDTPLVADGFDVADVDVGILAKLFQFVRILSGEKMECTVEFLILSAHGADVQGAVGIHGGHHGEL